MLTGQLDKERHQARRGTDREGTDKEDFGGWKTTHTRAGTGQGPWGPMPASEAKPHWA